MHGGSEQSASLCSPSSHDVGATLRGGGRFPACLLRVCVCVCGGISNSCATATASCDELMLSSATSVARTQLTESSRLWLWLVNETSTAAVTAQCTE